MKATIKNSMQPMKKENEDKKVEQKQRRIWDPGKFQVETLEQ